MILFMFNGNSTIPIVPGAGYVSETWYQSIVGILQATCPEATALIRAQSLNRANWLNLMKSNNLVKPYIVLETKPDYQEDVGRDNISFRQPITITYIASTSAPSGLVGGGGYDITQFVESRAIDIRANIITYSGSGFQVMNNYPSIDVSEFNPANTTIYTLQSTDFAAQIRAELLWGASNVDGILWGPYT